VTLQGEAGIFFCLRGPTWRPGRMRWAAECLGLLWGCRPRVRTMAAFRRTTNGERRVILPLPAEGGRLDVLVGDRGLLELTKAGRSIVLFERGTPFSEGEILWWSSIYREADWSPSSSRISFPRLAPGTYEVCLVPVSGYHQWLLGYRERGACDSGTLSYLGELELDVSKALRGGKSE